MLGVFAAQNLMLFFIFFEITLPPMFLLIGKWGKLSSEKAAYSYLIYNGIGSAILLIVFSVLFAKTGTTNITELKEILTSVGAGGGMAVPNSLQFGLFLSIMIAFAIKLPVFPLHRWMVNVHIEAHPAVVMLHAGVLLKIGAIRYNPLRTGTISGILSRVCDAHCDFRSYQFIVRSLLSAHSNRLSEGACLF